MPGGKLACVRSGSEIRRDIGDRRDGDRTGVGLLDVDVQPLVAKVIDRDPVSVALEPLYLTCSSVDFEQRWLPGIRSGD